MTTSHGIQRPCNQHPITISSVYVRIHRACSVCTVHILYVITFYLLAVRVSAGNFQKHIFAKVSLFCKMKTLKKLMQFCVA